MEQQILIDEFVGIVLVPLFARGSGVEDNPEAGMLKEMWPEMKP